MAMVGTHASPPITASMLYDLVLCPHRVAMDLFADPAERDPVSPFLQLLWDRGATHEQQVVIAGLGEPFLDLSMHAGSEKERRTLEAMDRGEPLIYGGRISADDLLGELDLLRRQGTGYIAGDIRRPRKRSTRRPAGSHARSTCWPTTRCSRRRSRARNSPPPTTSRPYSPKSPDPAAHRPRAGRWQPALPLTPHRRQSRRAPHHRARSNQRIAWPRVSKQREKPSVE